MTVEVVVPPGLAMAVGVIADSVKTPPLAAEVTVTFTTFVCVTLPTAPLTVTA